MASVIQLKCQCNDYAWGKIGRDSLAAQYAAATPGTEFTIDETKEYAEMWMGTYPTTPSSILSSAEDLQEHINANKEKLIGKAILSKFGPYLPFLPKILSIAKALPLQIHPSKELASRLHEEDPEKFGDPNHKPEIAVALGKFECFVGFMPLPEIEALFTSVTGLARFISAQKTKFDNETLRELLRCILSSSDEDIADVYTDLERTPVSKFGKNSYIPGLLPRLAEQYSKSDPGNLVALLTMNYMVLQKGDAIYIPADGIHAYLSGDIVECMARSDNVLNTGFCPRADRDSVDLFTSALTFNPHSAEDAILRPKYSDKGRKDHTTVLAPPMSEFNMLVTKLEANETETIQALQGPGIMVVTSGTGQLKAEGKHYALKEGYVFFIGYNTELELVAVDRIETYIAYCET